MHIIVGDFNLQNINWDVMSGPGDDVSNTVLKFFLNNGYNQLVSFLTRGSNMLDLWLTDTDMLVTNVAFRDSSVTLAALASRPLGQVRPWPDLWI